MRTTVAVVVLLLMAVVMAIFAGQNPQAVQVRFFGWQMETSLVAVIMGAAAAGGILVGTVSVLRYLISGLRQREMASDLRRLKQERDELRDENQKLLSQVRQLAEEDASEPVPDAPTSADEPADRSNQMQG